MYDIGGPPQSPVYDIGGPPANPFGNEWWYNLLTPELRGNPGALWGLHNWWQNIGKAYNPVASPTAKAPGIQKPDDFTVRAPGMQQATAPPKSAYGSSFWNPSQAPQAPPPSSWWVPGQPWY